MKGKTALIVAVFGMMCLPMLAGTVTVYVGYADNLRASGFFPTPWLGDPGVVSETPTGQSLDTGAIRIDNNTGASIVISGMTVVFGGGQTFNFWMPLTIPNGETGIFTQTGSYNFDTSDFGLFGGGAVNVDASHPLGGCTNPQGATEVANCLAYQPKVTFSVDAGAPTTYTDAGHILDTFGYDLINLGPPGGDGNESINWNLIGSTPTRGGTTPEPSTTFLVLPALAGIGLLGRRLRRS